MYDDRLVRKINSGECFALVGSGPSTEAGYPSWYQLATDVITFLADEKKLSDPASYAKYLAAKKYPELFTQAQEDFGSRAALVSFIASNLVRSKPLSYRIYEFLAAWPFRCYLTTNWDDEISKALTKQKVFFKTIQNTKPELAQFRADSRNVILKLHADLSHPDTAVITSGDYHNLSVSPAFEYWRAKLRSIFEMFDVCVIGHSLSDPDLQLVLQIAKETASPDHPIFMFTADVTNAELREYFLKYNIVVQPYDNSDGKHTQLRRLLSFIDKFIVTRHKRFDVPLVTYSTEEIEAAQAMAIYRRLDELQMSKGSAAQYLGPMVLQALWRKGADGCTRSDLEKAPPLSIALATEAVKQVLDDSLVELQKVNLVVQEDSKLRITSRGLEGVEDIEREKQDQEDQAFGEFIVHLKATYPALTPVSEAEAKGMLRDALVRVFKQRGISIADAIFTDRSLNPNALSDVFQAITAAARAFQNDREMAIGFMEAAQGFVLEPSEAQRRFLASISQGYFLYHLFGLDPTCAKVRRDVLAQTIWWCDASTLLPLIAAGSQNHDFASKLFGKVRSLGATLLTTTRLVQEVWEHLEWVVRLFEHEAEGSAAFLAAALHKGSYKENLFLDGYIRLSAEGRIGRFRDYLQTVVKKGVNRESIEDALEQLGVKVVNIHQLRGYGVDDQQGVTELAELIRKEREKRASYRSELQIEAEAEILQIIRGLTSKSYEPPVPGMHFERSYFLSLSRILDRIPPNAPISWTPEALYRYITALPGENADPDLLQKCMLQEYFVSGVVVIDKPRYEKFFGHAIDEARLKYSEERDAYLKDAAQHGQALDDAFRQVSDLDKPFFVAQMGWGRAAVAEKVANEATRKARELEAEVLSLRKQQGTAWRKSAKVRQRQELARERNLKDPQHLRKRERQAKKRTRKKRKH